MKTTIKILGLATLFVSANTAFADHHIQNKKTDAMMEMCDTNKDGMISKEEYTDEKMKNFQKFDKNNDNMLDKEEHAMMVKEMHKMMMGNKK